MDSRRHHRWRRHMAKPDVPFVTIFFSSFRWSKTFVKMGDFQSPIVFLGGSTKNRYSSRKTNQYQEDNTNSYRENHQRKPLWKWRSCEIRRRKKQLLNAKQTRLGLSESIFPPEAGKFTAGHWLSPSPARASSRWCPSTTRLLFWHGFSFSSLFSLILVILANW